MHLVVGEIDVVVIEKKMKLKNQTAGLRMLVVGPNQDKVRTKNKYFVLNRHGSHEIDVEPGLCEISVLKITQAIIESIDNSTERFDQFFGFAKSVGATFDHIIIEISGEKNETTEEA